MSTHARSNAASAYQPERAVRARNTFMASVLSRPGSVACVSRRPSTGGAERPEWRQPEPERLRTLIELDGFGCCALHREGRWDDGTVDGNTAWRHGQAAAANTSETA